MKQCAALRRTYLEYFLNGKNVGDCVLAEDCRGARVTGYVRDDCVLLFAVKRTDDDAVLHMALRQFIPADGFTATVRDANDQELSVRSVKADDTLMLSGTAGELFVVELAVRQ